jgi:3-oxoacyl-(acyl-carrier-protein) synthase
VLGPVTRSADRTANGTVTNDTRLGEGAAFLSLEVPEVARARGARVLGEVVGYGTSFFAPEESSLVYPSREAMKRAITSALADAQLAAADVDLVVSSVAGLPQFDDEELAAVRDVLEATAVVAPKLALGETLGAGGTIGMAASLAWLAGAPVAKDLVVGGRLPAKVRNVVVTTIGYYGNASAVVMRAPSSA